MQRELGLPHDPLLDVLQSGHGGHGQGRKQPTRSSTTIVSRRQRKLSLSSLKFLERGKGEFRAGTGQKAAARADAEQQECCEPGEGGTVSVSKSSQYLTQPI